MNRSETLYMRELPVRIANNLIQKSQLDLTAAQFDILTHIISMVKPTEQPGHIYELYIKDYYEMKGCDKRSGGNYADFKSNIDAIDKLRFWIKIGEKKTRLQWFHILRIDEGSGTIEVSFNDDVVPYLYNLTGTYTERAKINGLVLESKYSKFLYYYLCSNANRGGITVSIEDFCKEACPNKYKEYKDIKRRVLDVAKAEINALTDIVFLYEPQKRGGSRKYTHIKFTIVEKAMTDEAKKMRRDRANAILDKGGKDDK